MSTRIIVQCDQCGTEKESLYSYPENAVTFAIEQCGWNKQDGQLLCPDCVESNAELLKETEG